MQEIDDKAKAKAEAGWRIDAPEISDTIIPLILSARPGAQVWFSNAAKAGLTFTLKIFEIFFSPPQSIYIGQ